ncbi:DUF3108 domain-containing protein [Roseibium salinum]|uniref:DUF3108 domain-containing protein n=1 Tax=Roseibium salinum TaxID=1604349 RepID=A0ABT3R1S3_9HYPH|nr:DUF3108 domain-containing protein [Roseibium sp. DSM 29163]MCX2723100.1 DUF3108 domain-containing protein [Roseibium sp. DSM 29163]MDN3718965.1 DUF3108 domain-containing protein [Roseibium salinum]
MRLTALMGLGLAYVLLAGEASAADLYVKYKLYALSLPIGSGTLSLDVGDEVYSVRADGQTAAFGRLISDGKGSVKARGGIRKLALQPETYAFDLKSEDETGTVSMNMRAGKVDKVAVNPPQDRMKERIKVTADHLKGVVDPLTAALLPAPKGLSKESCNRTLQIFDGKERYNVHMHYKSRKSMTTADGRFKGDTIVCGVRYEPVSGHRPKRKSIQELAANTSLEVWLAPVGDKPFLVPLRASISLPFGRVVIQAEKYKLSKQT